MAPTILCTAQASYKKAAGVATLSSRTLSWAAGAGTGKLEVDVSNQRLQSLFSSKEGSAKVMLKIGALPASTTAPQVEEFFNFTFVGGASAVSDQQNFKREISTIVGVNRERGLSGDAAAAEENQGDGAASNGQDDKGKARPTALQSIFQLRRKVLLDDPALAALHKELVIGALISESEFWDGREGLVAAAAADERQKSGKSGEMVDPRPETAPNGEITVRITPTLVREIFEEYPSVLRAYGDNVPRPLDEQQFWSRYFQSKLFNRNRTTNRAVVDTIRDDDIFDLYLDEEDDDLEPKNLQVEHIYRLLDLAATEDDQHEITNRGDVTMRAGGQRSSLPLMRRFNEHSERLLNSSLGHQAKRTRMALDPGNAGIRNAYCDDIILEDLTASTTQDRIILETQNKKNATSAVASKSSGSNSADGELGLDEDQMEEVLQITRAAFAEWTPNLGSFTMNHAAITNSMVEMTRNVKNKAARADREANSNAFSESFLQQMTTVQASSNEFLRQFWSAVLPPKPIDPLAPVTAPTVPPMTPVQKAAKAERMKGYLLKMEDKVAIVFQDAQKQGINLVRVEAALQPVRAAVAHAIAYFDSRTTSR